jgi:hypothetical protein
MLAGIWSYVLSKQHGEGHSSTQDKVLGIFGKRIYQEKKIG